MRAERNDRATRASTGTKILPCSLVPLAASGVGTAVLSQTPSLVRVEGGELQAWSLTESNPSKASLSQHSPLATCGGAPPAGGAVDGRAPGRGIRAGLLL
jgi:hypothetical protein